MPSERRLKINKDPAAWLTHFGGLVGAIAGLVFLVAHSAHDPAKVTSMAIYGGSLVAVFASSTTYHFLDLGEHGNRTLQRIDHAAIYCLIAGTYAPATMHLLDGAWRITMLSVVGGLALVGIGLKVLWIDCPERLSTVLYVALGWIAIIPSFQMLPRMDPFGIAALVLGGLAYTVGAVVFVKHWPNPWPDVFGYHEVWHLFVLLGAGIHFVFVWSLMEKAIPAF
jgi:hemolysin III